MGIDSKTQIELSTWKRKDHFEFFKAFREPFFGVTLDVDCSQAFEFSKKNGVSFFQLYLHTSLKAANEVEGFRLRISGDKVFLYDRIHASPTIPRPDGTFGFSYMDYDPEFEVFSKHATQVIEQVKNSSGLNPAVSGENVIHYSSLPWIAFTSLSHARSLEYPDSCPKISFGKMIEAGGKRTMPMSVHVHHALADGYDVGLYTEAFQDLLNSL